MIKLSYRKNDKINTTSNFNEIVKISKDDFVWVDVLNISEQEKLQFIEVFGIKLQSPKKKKIRHSFRYIEKENALIINTGLLSSEVDGLISKPVTFILEDNFIISYHNISHLSFDELYSEIKNKDCSSLYGRLIFLNIFEKILEFDIDIIENITNDIVELSNKITIKEELDEDLIYKITSLQEMLIHIRSNIIDKQRVVSSIYKSQYFSKGELQKHISLIEKDINSILDYTSFDFERLEYLQDTLMGLINLRQNVIMKIFTIVSVIFLPPTLIASIYGMNFADMPELKIQYAYPVAITIMILVSLLALFIFKRKRWI